MELNLKMFNIDLNSVLCSSYMAPYHFRRSPKEGEKCNLLSPVAAISSIRDTPLYVATKCDSSQAVI